MAWNFACDSLFVAVVWRDASESGAGLIGALLAWLMEYFGLTAATSAHVGANLISVLRSECGILSLSGMGMGGIVVETGIAAVLCVLSVWLLWRKVDRDYGGKYNG